MTRPLAIALSVSHLISSLISLSLSLASTKAVLANTSQYEPNCAFAADGPGGVLNMTGPAVGETMMYISSQSH